MHGWLLRGGEPSWDWWEPLRWCLSVQALARESLRPTTAVGAPTTLVPGGTTRARDRKPRHRPTELGLERLPHLLLPLAGNGQRLQPHLGWREPSAEAGAADGRLLRPGNVLPELSHRQSPVIHSS